MPKKVLVFGTFDGLHEGHKNFFTQAKQHGDYIIAVIGRDANVEKLKGKRPKFTELERQKAVQECGLVNEARLGNESVPGKPFDPYKVIEQVRPDIICLGYDQTFFVEKLTAELPKRGLGHIQIVRLEAFEPEKYHSSILNKQ